MEKRLGSKWEEQTVKGSTTDEKGEEEKTTDLWPSCRSRNRRQFPFPWLCRALHRKKECLERRKRKTQRLRGITPPQTHSRAEARAWSLFPTPMQRTCTQSPRIRVYDATHPRKHQSMRFSYRLYNR
jgi:hypothetical protein